jgi:hypothetical protein
MTPTGPEGSNDIYVQTTRELEQPMQEQALT